ncbi:MAG: winged-helix domain-containing protein [Clostridia bacterium]|nr:winged-helix domain-containing protein [Clostridia bacterium]
MSRTVLLCGADACLTRMLVYELTLAGFTVAGEQDQPDCALVDLDSASLPTGLPAVAYSRRGSTAPEGVPVLVRPFAVEALLDALARLGHSEAAAQPTPGGLRLDDATHTVTRGGTRLALMPAEYAVLRRLLDAEGEPVSRTELIGVLPSGSTPTSNLAEVVICTLRRKLEASFDIRPIRTVRGIGYRYTL